MDTLIKGNCRQKTVDFILGQVLEVQWNLETDVVSMEAIHLDAKDKGKFLMEHVVLDVSILQVNVAHSFLYRFAVEHIFMPVECCRLLKLSHPFSKWTRPSPRTNQKAHQTIAFMNNCKRCAWENTNLSNWHKYMFN